MEIAEKHFRIPMVLEPEYLSSPHLDELSGMTYLSYFMKEEASPGYYATLDWVKRQIPDQRINNFRVSKSDILLNYHFWTKNTLLDIQQSLNHNSSTIFNRLTGTTVLPRVHLLKLKVGLCQDFEI